MRYSPDTVKRSLDQHRLAGAVEAWSHHPEDRRPWRVSLRHVAGRDSYLVLNDSQVYALLVGMTARALADQHALRVERGEAG